jgi:hypothetical protein
MMGYLNKLGLKLFCMTAFLYMIDGYKQGKTKINPTGAFSSGCILFAKVDLVVLSIIRFNVLY